MVSMEAEAGERLEMSNSFSGKRPLSSHAADSQIAGKGTSG